MTARAEAQPKHEAHAPELETSISISPRATPWLTGKSEEDRCSIFCTERQTSVLCQKRYLHMVPLPPGFAEQTTVPKKETEKRSFKSIADGGGGLFDGFITAAGYVKDLDPGKTMILAAAAGCGPEYQKSEALKQLSQLAKDKQQHSKKRNKHQNRAK